MTTYVNNRDGGKTNEEGHLRFQAKVWSGNIVSGLQAVARSPLAMGINISVGDAKIDYSTYGYHVWTDAIVAVGIATADPSNPRIDRIVGYVDLAVTPSSTNSNNPGLLKFMAIAGTPAASPSRPSNVTVQAAVGASNPYFDIADVLVGTGVTTIDNSKITDTRVMIYGSTNKVETDTIVGKTDADSGTIYGIAVTNGLVDTTKISAGWVTSNPTFDVATIDNGSGGQPTINTSRYTKVGNLITVQLNATGVKAGTGKNIIITAWTLPTPATMTTGQFVGVAGYDDTAIYQPGLAVVYRGSGVWWIVRATDISDNATLSKLSTTFSYEAA